MHNDETVISDAPDMINKAPIIPGHLPDSVACMSGSEHTNTTITTNSSTTESVPVLVPRPGPVEGHGTGSVVVQVAEKSSVTGCGSGIHNRQIISNASVTGISSDHGAGASGISSSSSLSQQQHQQQNGHELDNKDLNTTSTVVEEQQDNLKNNSVTNISIDKSELLPFLLFSSPPPYIPNGNRTCRFL